MIPVSLLKLYKYFFFFIIVDDYDPLSKWQEYPCQIFYNIKTKYFKRCDESPPAEWQVVEPPTSNVDQIRIHFKDGDTRLITFEASPHLNFQIAPDPLSPEFSTIIRLKPNLIEDPYDGKFCYILILFLFILLSCSCLTLSLVGKYYIEKMRFDSEN